MNKAQLESIVKAGIELATKNRSVSRGKAFAMAFERFEVQFGKPGLTEPVKREIRAEVDRQMFEAAKFLKSDVITKNREWDLVDSDGTYRRGKTVTTEDTRELSAEARTLAISRKLEEHRLKVSKKVSGATEGDMRKERRLKNAFFAGLHEIKLEGVKSQIVDSMLAYAAKLCGIPGEHTEKVEEVPQVA